ncbi:MAG: primosomal protein N' [Sedimentisphaerales bacterium]|nr:primosomal protein N' [Sedimentisphaerales bacterium]
MTQPRSQTPGLFGPIDDTQPKHSLVDARQSRIVRLAFETAGDNLFDYALPHELAHQVRLGQRVRAPLGRGNRPEIGFCVEFPQQSDVERVKNITEIIDPEPLLSAEMIELARWISQYYCCPLGVTLSAMVPAAVKHQIGLRPRSYVCLTESFLAQDDAFKNLRLSAPGRAIVDYLIALPHHGSTPVAIDDITQKLGCTAAPFKTLQKLSVVHLSQRQELPLPPGLERCSCFNTPGFPLNNDQTQALAQLLNIINQPTFNAVLLHGVTGSGKTEVYIRAIQAVVQAGGQALVLVPEISLTPQTVSRFLQRFECVAVLHSGLTNSQRHQQWQLIAQGKAQVVVGARSAIFAPLPKLKLIIVDEEHEPSYKQDKAPRYHGRDVAVKRAHLLNVPVILGSATPSLETYNNCKTKDHYHLINLPRRVLDLPMPKVHIINMKREFVERKGNHILSRALETELRRCLQEHHQAILLLNRRGHSSYLFCPSCEFVVTCPNCDISMTLHKRRRDGKEQAWMMCHYCLHSTRVPTVCSVCGKKLLRISPGTQHAEEELARKMPDVRFCRVDSDSIKPGQYERILSDFAAGKYQLLLGTQMIGKGLDFPNVALVGVINADTALNLPDFRSSERTFQLVAQVAGRCGRAADTGRVIVQTFLPDDPAIALSCQHDYEAFAQGELRIRESCEMPPYHRLARIVLRDTKLNKVESAAAQLRQAIDTLLPGLSAPLAIRGPMPAPIATIENYHRYEILLKAAQPAPIHQLLSQLRTDHLPKLPVHTIVDVDPLNLL